MIRYNRNGEYNVPFGRYVNFNTGILTQEHNQLLQGAQILNTDYANVLIWRQMTTLCFWIHHMTVLLMIMAI